MKLTLEAPKEVIFYWNPVEFNYRGKLCRDFSLVFQTLLLKLNKCSNWETNPELRPSRDKAPWSAERLPTGTGSSSVCPPRPPGGAPTPSASRYGRPGWTRPGGRPLDRGHPASGRPPAGTNLDADRRGSSLFHVNTLKVDVASQRVCNSLCDAVVSWGDHRWEGSWCRTGSCISRFNANCKWNVTGSTCAFAGWIWLEAAVLCTLPPLVRHVTIKHQVPWLTLS